MRGSTRSPRISSSLSRALGLVRSESLWSEPLVEHRFGDFSLFACLERREKSERMVRPGPCLMRIMRMGIAASSALMSEESEVFCCLKLGRLCCCVNGRVAERE